MKTSPISPICTRAIPLSYLALGLTVGCATVACAPLALAQNGKPALMPLTTAPAPLTAPSPATPLPVAPDISILIVALDDLSAPSAASASVPAAPAPNAVAGAPFSPAPIAPVGGMGAAVTPAAFGGPMWQWRAQAQVKRSREQKRLDKAATKERKRRAKEAEDARLYNLEPAQRTPNRAASANNSLPPRVPEDDARVVRAPGDALNAQIAPPPLAPPVAIAPGRSQNVAVPLRRALLAQGYKDVQVVTPESNTVIRAIGEGRLSLRVINELKRSLATLAANEAAGAPADVSATIAAGRAASRIGQATGYRAVIGFYVGDPAQIEVVGAGAGATTQKIGANMVVADAQRESVEPLQFVATGDNEEVWRQTSAISGADLLDGALRDWPATSSDGRPRMALVHLESARSAYERGDLARAQDELNQSIALDSSQTQPFILRGDILRSIDPSSAANAYSRALEMDESNGQDWARIAAAYAYAPTPDWRAAWDAGKRALALNYDSAPLRVALATAQYGRAEQFRKYDYKGKAEEAEIEARGHLERALQLAPNDPTAVRLLARDLLEKRRFEEAARTLDRIAPRYPGDVEIQSQYAFALGNQVGREEDAFAAHARVWKLKSQNNVVVDAITYRTLARGFDQRLFNLGKLAIQLSRGVASRAVERQTALIQLTKLKEEMDDAQAAITVMRPSSAVGATSVAARVFAADLMNQSLESFQSYIETGQISDFERGDGLYRQAVAQLNTARS